MRGGGLELNQATVRGLEYSRGHLDRHPITHAAAAGVYTSHSERGIRYAGCVDVEKILRPIWGGYIIMYDSVRYIQSCDLCRCSGYICMCVLHVAFFRASESLWGVVRYAVVVASRQDCCYCRSRRLLMTVFIGVGMRFSLCYW